METEKIVIRKTKPRNPYVVPSIFRKAGEHEQQNRRVKRRQLERIRWKEAEQDIGV